jgi:hypothetical protein
MFDGVIPFPLNPDTRRRAKLAGSLAVLQQMRAASPDFARPATVAVPAPLVLRPLPVASPNPRYGVFAAPGKAADPAPLAEPHNGSAATEEAEAEDPVEKIRREAAESGARRRSAYEDSLRTIRALYGLPDDYEPSPLPPAA